MPQRVHLRCWSAVRESAEYKETGETLNSDEANERVLAPAQGQGTDADAVGEQTRIRDHLISGSVPHVQEAARQHGVTAMPWGMARDIAAAVINRLAGMKRVLETFDSMERYGQARDRSGPPSADGPSADWNEARGLDDGWLAEAISKVKEVGLTHAEATRAVDRLVFSGWLEKPQENAVATDRYERFWVAIAENDPWVLDRVRWGALFKVCYWCGVRKESEGVHEADCMWVLALADSNTSDAR